MKVIFIKLQKLKPFFYFLIFTAFYLKGLILFDPDFGWRIKAGEYFWQNGIPKTDVFTYTMPNFPWVDHAWGMSLVFYLVNKYLGYPVLVFFATFLVMVVMIILSRFIKNNNVFKSGGLNFVISSRFIPSYLFKLKLLDIHPFNCFLFFFSASIFLPFFGVRAQVIGWLFFSLLVYLFSETRIYLKYGLFLPFLFLIWVNLHGSFSLGISILVIYVLLKFTKKREISFKDLLILFFSIMATFINPYKGSVWREVWSSVSDSNLRFKIAEWMPALTMFDLTIVFWISLSFVLIKKYFKKYSSFELFVFVFLFIQALSSRRQIPFLTIFSFPLLIKSINFFVNDVRKLKSGILRFKKVYKIALAISFVTFLVQMYFSLRSAYFLRPESFYPVGAVNYLKKNLPKGEIFSYYGWGGYLIMNLPQKKVFIDGRMPSWRWDPKNLPDLNNAFKVYDDILSGKVDYGEVFKKFNIDTVLAVKQDENKLYEYLFKVMRSIAKLKDSPSFIESIENDDWIRVYEDDISVIYQKS